MNGPHRLGRHPRFDARSLSYPAQTAAEIPSWGDRGRFRMSWDDLDHLLADRGEAVTITPA